MASKHEYQVVVGNIGTVFTGEDRETAERVYTDYLKQSREGGTRAAGESVVLLENGEPIREHLPGVCPDTVTDNALKVWTAVVLVNEPGATGTLHLDVMARSKDGAMHAADKALATYFDDWKVPGIFEREATYEPKPIDLASVCGRLAVDDPSQHWGGLLSCNVCGFDAYETVERETADEHKTPYRSAVPKPEAAGFRDLRLGRGGMDTVLHLCPGCLKRLQEAVDEATRDN